MLHVCSLRLLLFWKACFSLYMVSFSLQMWSIVPLWAQVSAQCLDYPICKTNNCWRTIDVYFHDGVTQLSWTVSNEKAPRTSYMNFCHNATLRLAKMQDQQSLTLHSRSLSGWGREHLSNVFAPKGGQFLIYGCFQPIASWITHDARLKIIDARLTLIFRIEQRVCCFCFCV